MSQPHVLLQFFVYSHLPPHLARVSKPFAALAHELDDTLPDNAEKTTAIRRLLEAKDCAVRAVLYRESGSVSVHLAEPGTAAAFDEATGTERKAGEP